MHNEGFNFWSNAQLASLRRNSSTRKAIEHFKKNDCENIYQAWGRFTNLVKSVHHHGFSFSQLFQFFYEGLDEYAQACLFILDGGTLMDKTVEEAWEYLDSILKEQPIVEEEIEEDVDDGVIMSEDEDGTIHFHWKKEVLEEETSDEDESESLEASEECQGLLLYIDEDDLIESEQVGHLQAFEESFQQFTQVTPMQTIVEDEGKFLDYSFRLFDMVASSSIGYLHESLIAEKETFISDLLEIEEPPSFIPLCKEEREDFPILDSQEEETIRDMCMDSYPMVPTLPSLQVVSHHHPTFSMQDEPYTIHDTYIPGSIRQSFNNFIYFIDDPLWKDFFSRHLSLNFSNIMYLFHISGFHSKEVC